jgi:hypothetical protein
VQYSPWDATLFTLHVMYSLCFEISKYLPPASSFFN